MSQSRKSKPTVGDVLVAAGAMEESDLCQRCRCCSADWIHCESCGGDGSFSDEEYGDPLWPEHDRPCDICEGKGGWPGCLGNCNENGVHERRAEEPR